MLQCAFYLKETVLPSYCANVILGLKCLQLCSSPPKHLFARTLGRACDMCRTHCRSEGHFRRAAAR